MDQIKKKSEKGVETTFHDNMGHVEESEIGKSVRFVQNAMESDKTSGSSLSHKLTRARAHTRYTRIRSCVCTRSHICTHKLSYMYIHTRSQVQQAIWSLLYT
jgi:hypothetical protein